MKRVVAVAVLMSMVPAAGALLLVRPAVAAPEAAVVPVYDQVGLTALLSGVRTDGTVGASGGLVTLDTGSAYLAARLDAAPSSQVLAAPYQPGALARTVVGQVNGGAGSAVLEVPEAEARFPGQGSDALETVPPQVVGPLSMGGGSATAVATATRAAGTSTGAASGVAGAYTAGPSTSSAELTAFTDTGRVRQTGRTDVSRVEVAGVLVLEDVVATASVTADGDVHTAAQSLVIGGASVAGQTVVVGNDGVQAVGTAVLPGQTLADATAQANAQLAAAGVTVQTVGGRSVHDARSATADTGGVRITLATPDLPGGVAANTLTMVVGGVVLTELDTRTVPAALPPPDLDPGTVVTVPPGTSTITTFVPGTPGIPGTAVLPPDTSVAGPQPQVAPDLVPTAYLVSGRRVSAQAALLAFAGWQFLTLATATLYAFVERRRRLLLLGRAT